MDYFFSKNDKNAWKMRESLLIVKILVYLEMG